MARRLFGLAALLAALVLASQDASGFGKRSSGCESTCTTAGACTPAYTVQYVDQKVTGYRCEWKTKKAEVVCIEHRTVQEPYKCVVREPVMTKKMVKVCQMVPTQQKYTCTVYERFPVIKTVKVCERVPVTTEERYTYCVPVMTKTRAKKLVCETVCVPVQVPCPPPSCDDCGRQRVGLFARLCARRKNDCNQPCAAPVPPPCPAPCPPPPPIFKTVMQKKVITREVEVDVLTCTMVKKEGIRPVTRYVPTWVEREVTVWDKRPVQKTGVRTVGVPVWTEREVNVCSYRLVEREGVRNVCKPFEVKKIVDQRYCVMVPFETTVKVPVCTPCAAQCPSPCAPTGMSGGCGRCR